MTNFESTTTQSQRVTMLKAVQLEKSPLNARRTIGHQGIDELKASILSHGLMQNLVVTDNGNDRYLVIAGGRRLEAIHSLQSEGKLPDDFAVPCQIVTEEHALEMSLAENMVRLAMHPADQFQAFADLIDQGATAAKVARRFGIEESLVHKRMRLARVAPELIQLYRDEGMTLECLMAFTVTDDHHRQHKVYESLQDWQKDDPATIRAALTEKLIDAGSKLVRFLGLETYRAAGGTCRSDLFSEEVYLEDPALFNNLVANKLDGIRRELETEGWGWVEINPDRDWNAVNRCSRIQPQLIGAPSELLDLKAQLDAELTDIERDLEDNESDELDERQQAIRERLDALKEELVTFVGFDDEQKALAGCYVSIGHDGELFIDKGLVKPDQRKQLAKLMGIKDLDCESVKTKQKGSFPESLRRDLAIERLEIAQVEIAKTPLIALDLLIYQAALSLLDQSFVIDGADVLFRRQRSNSDNRTGNSAACTVFEEMAASLPLDWITPTSEAARFEAFRSLSETAKLQLLAYCVALTLKPKLAPTDSEDITAYDVALQLTNGNAAEYWTPSKKDFLSRITRDQLLSIGREVFGDTWSQSRASDKKSSLVDQLDRAFSNPEKSGRTPDQIEKLKSWLPTGMSFDIPPVAERPEPGKTGNAA